MGGFTGSAGDSLSYHNMMAFSTEDVDNDLHERHCAAENKVRGVLILLCSRWTEIFFVKSREYNSTCNSPIAFNSSTKIKNYTTARKDSFAFSAGNYSSLGSALSAWYSSGVQKHVGSIMDSAC